MVGDILILSSQECHTVEAEGASDSLNIIAVAQKVRRIPRNEPALGSGLDCTGVRSTDAHALSLN